MKKGLFFILMGWFFLVPFGLLANSFPTSKTFNLPAPGNLHIVNTGPNWLQVAWDEVQGAEIYQVTTRVTATGAVVSMFNIDATQVTINNLEPVEHTISVAGIRNNVMGQEASVNGTPDCPLVFDIIPDFAPQNEPPGICNEICSFTGLPYVGPTPEPFTCPLEWNSQAHTFNSIWVKAELPESVQPDPNSALLMHMVFQPEPCEQYIIYVTIYQGSPREWIWNVPDGNSYLMHFHLDPKSPNNLEFVFQNGSGFLNVNLFEGYRFTVYRECQDGGEIPSGGNGLAAEQSTPEMHAEQTINNDLTQNDFNIILTPKASPAFRVVNPVKNELELFFEQPTGQAAVLELYSMNGTLAARKRLPEGVNNYSLPASDLVPGTYLLRVHQDSGVETRLVIKQ